MYYISRYFYSGRRETGDIMNYRNVNDTDRQAIYVDSDEPSITVELELEFNFKMVNYFYKDLAFLRNSLLPLTTKLTSPTKNEVQSIYMYIYVLANPRNNILLNKMSQSMIF